MIMVTIVVFMLMDMFHLFMGMLVAMLTHDFLIVMMGMMTVIMAMDMSVSHPTVKMPVIGRIACHNFVLPEKKAGQTEGCHAVRPNNRQKQYLLNVNRRPAI